MKYYTEQTLDVLADEGNDFCNEHSLPIGMFDGMKIVRGDDIRQAVGQERRDPSKYYLLHEVPHVVWCLENGIYIV